jgi:hypothetical protein
MDESISLSFTNLDIFFQLPHLSSRSGEQLAFRFLITPNIAKLAAEEFNTLEVIVKSHWYSLTEDERDKIKKVILELSKLDIKKEDRIIVEFFMRILLSWSSLLCLTNFFAVYKAKIRSIVETVIDHIDRENREYLATIPIGDRWLDHNPEAKSLVDMGLQQAATGKSTYLGSFAEYASLEIDD